MSKSGKKHILFVSILVASFVAFGEEVKTQVAKADSLISDDVLVDDLDKDVLNASKSAPADAAKKDSAKSAPSVKIKESDEVLILDGGAEDLLGTTKSDKPTDSVSKPLQQVEAPKTQGTVQNSDSIGTKSTANVSVPADSGLAKVTAQTTPAKIEAASSINFARNLKDYRSPKIAMLLSFLLPGAGEIYAKNGYRAAAFGVVEVGIIATGVVYAVKGKNQLNEAYEFADLNYSVDRFKTYYKNLASNFPSIVDTIFSSYDDDVNPLEFSKNTSDYNDLIGDQAGPYVQGWNDVTPTFNENFELSDTSYHRIGTGTDSTYDSSYLVVDSKDSTKIAYGFSKNQEIYNSKVAKGNKLYKVSKNIFTMLVINHIVSAIDAGICAKAYNDKLLGKQTLWQRINIKDIALNSGSGTASGYALEVRF
jgi:TM2 domain-containing membrane protein YozV